MKIGVSNERLVLVTDDGLVDVADQSGGLFSSDPMGVFEKWSEFMVWAGTVQAQGGNASAGSLIDGPAVPRPRQVFGIGLNYRLHAIEAGMPIPDVPLVFTKFPSAVAPAVGEVRLYTPMVDWEVELAVVIGSRARGVAREDAWDVVAGLTLAQDFSARDVQMTPKGTPQFSLGKSFQGFLPLGPILATPDEFSDKEDIHLWCEIDGVRVQDGRTSDFIFSIPQIIEYLSSVVELLPGDVILTGTPSGVGAGMEPPRFLSPGSVVTTGMDAVGEMRHEAVAVEPWEWKA